MEAETSGFSRRTVLSAGAGVPVTALLLAACGDDATTDDAGPGTSGTAPGSGTPPTEEPSGSLAAVADIPVGGALVVENGPGGKPVVLARPREGEVVAFSAICTHKGCTVKADGSALACPCHGSTFDLTGANTGGPAPSPLPTVEVTVADGQVLPA